MNNMLKIEKILEEISSHRFHLSLEGYDIQEVNAFFDTLSASLKNIADDLELQAENIGEKDKKITELNNKLEVLKIDNSRLKEQITKLEDVIKRQ
ncbi:DivIVA domain-containing protein [Mycoplasma corogypsi]|uniref:DivIVA domain-containing protein n=1 Tax=Mycoplasma corogypsi TaxID=2106 RepID=UPI0038732F8D